LQAITRVSNPITPESDLSQQYDGMMLNFILKVCGAIGTYVLLLNASQMMILLQLLQGSSFNGAMYAISELRRIVQEIMFVFCLYLLFDRADTTIVVRYRRQGRWKCPSQRG
jgi:hypothetical protein